MIYLGFQSTFSPLPNDMDPRMLCEGEEYIKKYCTHPLQQSRQDDHSKHAHTEQSMAPSTPQDGETMGEQYSWFAIIYIYLYQIIFIYTYLSV